MNYSYYLVKIQICFDPSSVFEAWLLKMAFLHSHSLCMYVVANLNKIMSMCMQCTSLTMPALSFGWLIVELSNTSLRVRSVCL